MIRPLLPLLGLLACGAAPAGSFSMAAPMPDFTPARRPPPAIVTSPGYTAAPTPDNDAAGPLSTPAKESMLGPGVFTRSDQYRGQGLSPSSSAQTGQDRRAKPGAGLKLSMPLQ